MSESKHSIELTNASLAFAASIDHPESNADVWRFVAARTYLQMKALEFAVAEGGLSSQERSELASLRIFREQVESLGWVDGVVVPSAAADELIALARRAA